MSLLNCPKCQQGKLFSKLLTLADECPNCGMSFADGDVGDGAVYIAGFAVSALNTIMAVWLDMAVEPPLWVHAALWIPAIIIESIWLLIYGKAWLFHKNYQHIASKH